MAALRRETTAPRSGLRTRSNQHPSIGSCKISWLIVWVVLILSSSLVLWQHVIKGLNIPDFEIDMETGKKRIRRRPDLLVKRDHSSGQNVPTYV